MNGMPKMLMLVKPFGTDQPGRRSNCLMLGGPPNGAIVAVPTALCPLPSVRVEWAGLCARGFPYRGPMPVAYDCIRSLQALASASASAYACHASVLQGLSPNDRPSTAPWYLAIRVLQPRAKAGPELRSQRGHPECCTDTLP